MEEIDFGLYSAAALTFEPAGMGKIAPFGVKYSEVTVHKLDELGYTRRQSYAPAVETRPAFGIYQDISPLLHRRLHGAHSVKIDGALILGNGSVPFNEGTQYFPGKEISSRHYVETARDEGKHTEYYVHRTAVIAQTKDRTLNSLHTASIYPKSPFYAEEPPDQQDWQSVQKEGGTFYFNLFFFCFHNAPI